MKIIIIIVLLKKNENFASYKLVKSPKIRNLRKFKHAKITRNKTLKMSVCRILHQDFWLMQMDLCLGLELSMGNYLRFFIAEVWSQAFFCVCVRGGGG